MALKMDVDSMDDFAKMDKLAEIAGVLLSERDWRELSRVAGLVAKYEQLSYIRHQIDDLVQYGPRSRRR